VDPSQKEPEIGDKKLRKVTPIELSIIGLFNEFQMAELDRLLTDFPDATVADCLLHVKGLP